MAQSNEGATEAVEAVKFGFMTDEEVRSHSVVKVTNPDLLDTLDKPIPGGLYDPAMGPLDENFACKTCGQRSYHCPGHCGHIGLVSPVYNPLLFNMLYKLLKKTCFHCFHFRSSRGEVENCVTQLQHISEGDIIGAKRLNILKKIKKKKGWEVLSNNLVGPEDSEGSHISDGEQHSDRQKHSEHNKLGCWDSCQFTEAMYVLHEFLKIKRHEENCENCDGELTMIERPTFGWFHVMGLTGNQTRSIAIRHGRLGVSKTEGVGDKSSSEVINASDCSREDNSDTAEANSSVAASDSTKISKKKSIHLARNFSQALEKLSFSGPLLPSEVREIVKRLWENESAICSYICDIQQQQQHVGSGKVAGHSMFFLETILVPPIKFRPPAKGGDSVMEHPHTLLLGKVLQSNIALGNVHVNSAEHSKIINRWMDLQQSINVLYDSKTATGPGKKDLTSGICQFLEKKEGIFRQKMMGKRVNFACRSVISPDPYLAVNEIGVPPHFALRLTYPEALDYGIRGGPRVSPFCFPRSGSS